MTESYDKKKQEGEKSKKRTSRKPAEPKAVPSTRKASAVKKRAARNDMAEEVLMPFGAWFSNEVTLDSRLKDHHREVIRLFMKSMGLRDAEPVHRYKMALKSYFGG